MQSCLVGTNNPNVKTIADFTDKDKIALPAVKLTGHALILEMEAAKIWGFDHYDKLDSITITRSHADAAASVMSGKSEINSHFASSPFYYYELATPGVHQVLKSYDVVGGKHTNGTLVATKKFHDANPKICAVVVAGSTSRRLHQHPREAAQSIKRSPRTRIGRDWKRWWPIDVDYTTTPVNVMFTTSCGQPPHSRLVGFSPEAHKERQLSSKRWSLTPKPAAARPATPGWRRRKPDAAC